MSSRALRPYIMAVDEGGRPYPTPNPLLGTESVPQIVERLYQELNKVADAILSSRADDTYFGFSTIRGLAHQAHLALLCPQHEVPRTSRSSRSSPPSTTELLGLI